MTVLRTKVHKILLGYGKWTQYSLFVWNFPKKELLLLSSKLTEHLDAKKERVRFYPLCANGCPARWKRSEDQGPAMISCFWYKLNNLPRVSVKASRSLDSRKTPGADGEEMRPKLLFFFCPTSSDVQRLSETIDSCGFSCYTTSAAGKMAGGAR